MLRLKKIHLFILIIIFTVIFFMIQLMFNFKISITHYKNDEFMKNNPKFGFWSRKQTNEKSSDIKNNKKFFKKVMKNELVIPLDPHNHNQPYLFHMLPFYHRINYVNFSRVMVESLVLVDDFNNFPKLVNTTQVTFVNIEDENRIKNKAVLKDSDLVQLPNSEDKQEFNHIRGVKLDKLHLYRPDSNGLFKCIDSNQKIPFTNLNDEFCDCVDGTDEPGTSACQFSTFYCTTQNEFLIDNHIPSSRVDDRICDCCDGSDESETIKCKNTCDEKIALFQKNFYENKKALAEKEKYIIHGLFNNERQYGPSGVFYKLSKKCFKINWSEFAFEVCPYKKCTQSKNGASTNIGSKSSLILSENQGIKKWILKMSDGEGRFCEKPRESFIHFECHHQDILKQVQEPEKCVYKFTLLTPGAC